MAERPLPAYDGDEPYVFVSYSHEDNDLVYPEIRWLQDQGFNVWWDEGISPGVAWRDEVAQALQDCSLILYFITPNSVQSEQCTREVNFGLDKFHRPVLAVHLVETTLPHAMGLSLSDRQAILRHELEPENYERKLLSTVAASLEQPMPTIDASRRRRTPSSQVKWLFLAATCSVVAALATWIATRPEPHVPRPLVRFVLGSPAPVGDSRASRVPAGSLQPFAISSDGRRIIFNVWAEGSARLYVRSLDALEAVPINGVEGQFAGVFISPDDEWIAFYDTADGDFKKVRMSGGAPVTIVKTALGITPGPMGLTWSHNGTIIFSTLEHRGLMRVHESGGTPEALTEPPRGERHGSPHLLGDGNAVLFAVGSSFLNLDRIAVLSLETGEQRILIEGRSPRVTSSGHLLFEREGSIWAMAFDEDRLEVRGAAVPVLEDVEMFSYHPLFSVATDGSMVYLPKGNIDIAFTLVWVDLNGRETAIPAPADWYVQPRVSPDGSRVAVRRGRDGVVWVHSLERNTTTKLTFEAGSYFPIWSPDGTKVIYSPERDNTSNLHWRNADGTGAEERLATSPRRQYATAWSRDGGEVLYFECDSVFDACDLGRLTLQSNPSAEHFLATEFNERNPALSPDGRWVAYESDLSGEFEVYVRPYPEVNTRRWQISTEGGLQPLWSPDGTTLYYIERRGMMSVAIEIEHGFTTSNPQIVFDLKPYFPFAGRNYALHPDGKRFIMVRLDLAGSLQLIFVQNWLEEVKRLVPTD